LHTTPEILQPPSASAEIAALRAIVEGTARNTGQEFLQSLVRHLAAAVGVSYAFVAEFASATRARTIAYWKRDRIVANVEWDLPGTPCEDVVRGNLCHHPTGVQHKFPQDRDLVELGIESYLGVPLCDAAGQHLGHLAVFDEHPLPEEPRRLFIFRIFAARAAAELERLRMEQRMQESERLYRDLYEEAPIGYLSTGVDLSLRHVNRRVTEWLGAASAELVGTSVLAYIADGSANQARAAEALRRFQAGQEVHGTELELRSTDGRPLWISLWIKPMCGADGTVQASRMIWVDITERTQLQQQNLYLQEEIKAEHNFEEIVGHSPALSAVLAQVRQVAPTDATVLIGGETGTGKELIARALHSASKRKDRPLIKVNCAALPTGLVESELFGHEKGAFTGALARRLGRFELAQGGTLFLDEIGELPADAQAKLLRVLQEREFERVGGTAAIKVDVRVLAATNRDLLQAVRARTFREDLFYRLNVFPLQLPPLRERPEDIPPLVHFLVGKFAARIGKRFDSVSPETLERLRAYSWPGNIRELENVLERGVILARGTTLEIGADVLTAPTTPAAIAPDATLEATERQHVLEVLRQTAWVIDGPRGAAKVLGLHPSTLRSRMKKLGIRRTPHDPS
jgi:PAS domain S-box-containing protein